MVEYSGIDKRQADYEHRRRCRLVGLSIDQTLTGVKNIIVHSNTVFWNVNDVEQWNQVKQDANNILVMAIALERKLSALADIYATMVPNNPEATTIPQELGNETGKV